jgi:hypothetical protein
VSTTEYLSEVEKEFVNEMQRALFKPIYRDWMVVETEPGWFGIDDFALVGNIDATVFIPTGGSCDEGLFGNFRIRGVHI